MYAVFGEFLIAHQTDTSTKLMHNRPLSVLKQCEPTSPHFNHGCSKLSTMSSKPTVPMTVFEFDFDDPKPRYNCDYRVPFGPLATRESHDDLTLLYFHRNRGGRQRQSVSSNNPLLDTISTIEDLCDLEDYDDIDPSYSFQWNKAIPSRKSSFNEGEKDIGYVGSNSIDSGYKSSCPTPDLPEGVYYSQECLSNQTKGCNSGLTTLQGGLQKPRIPMGTKVMSRHPRRALDNRASTKCNDPEFRQFMYLRHSYTDVSGTVEQDSPRVIYSEDYNRREFPPSTNPDHRPRMPSPRLNRIKRHTEQNFLDVDCVVDRLNNVSMHNSCVIPPNSSDIQSKGGQKAVRFNSDVNNDAHRGVRKCTSQKPILKDPLCDSLRCVREWCPEDANVPMFEEEIDTFLHGKAQYYDLEVVADLASGAAILKPNLPANQTNSSKRVHDPDDEPGPTYPSLDKSDISLAEESLLSQEILISDNTSSNDALTEVMSENSYVSRLSTNDYHVYEEILYDMINPKPRQITPPPPLPARPNPHKSRKYLVSEVTLGKLAERGRELFPKLRSRSSSVPNCLPDKAVNKPKQRGNLYTLWRDQGDRRSVSNSLEREFKDGSKRHIFVTPDDEYGFAVLPQTKI